MAGKEKEVDPFAAFTDHSNDEADTDGNLIVQDDSPEGGNDTTVDLLDEKGNADDQDNSDEEDLDDDETDGQVDDDDGSDNADGDDEDPDEDGDDENEAEGAGDNDDGDDVEDDQKPAPKKKRQTGEQRVAEFRKRQAVAERKASTAEARADRAEARLAEVEAGLTGGANDDTPTEDNNYGLTAPDPKDYKYGELDGKFQAANTDYQVDLKLAKRDAAQNASRQDAAARETAEGLKETYDVRVEDGIKTYDDFEEVVMEAADNGDYPLTEEVGMLALQSEVGHHVLYKIAGDLKLAKKLAAMTPAAQGREFGRLEAQFAKRTPPKKKNRTNATPPASRRRGNKSGTSRTPGNTQDFAAFEAQAEADERAQNRK